jgi:hypothetical protein
MRIYYKKLTHRTELSYSDLRRNIFTELGRPGYYIVKQDTKNIEFGYNIWRFGSRNEVFNRVDGGNFAISENGETIVLSFYISIMFEIIVTIIFAILALIKDYELLILIGFVWLMFLVRTVSVKKAGSQMLTNVAQHA